MTRKTGIEIQEYLSWCREFSVDPLTFLDARIRTTHRATNRLLQIRQLPSIKFKDGLYQEWAMERSANQALEEAGQDRMAAQIGGIDPPKVTTPLWESTKRAYALTGDYDLCRIAFDLTGGWNPASELCGFCPQADQCRDELTPKWRAYRDAVQQRIRTGLPASSGEELHR